MERSPIQQELPGAAAGSRVVEQGRDRWGLSPIQEERGRRRGVLALGFGFVLLIGCKKTSSSIDASPAEPWIEPPPHDAGSFSPFGLGKSVALTQPSEC